MRLRTAKPDIIVLRGRRGVGTPLIVGCALLAWPLLAATVAGPPTGDRLLAALVLVALASLFIWFGWPRARDLRIRPRERVLELGRRRAVMLPDDAAFRLVDAPAQPVAGPLRYGVALAWRGADPVLVLAGDDPAAVLRDLVRLRELLPLPVLAGWGLSHSALPWLSGVTPAATPALAAKEDPVEPSRRRATTVMIAGTVGAAGLLAMEMHGRASRGDTAIPISIVLPAIGIAILAAITFVVASLRPHVSAGTALSFEWRLGALRLFPRSVDARIVRSADVVSPLGAGGRHLLLLTDSGDFVAFPCERREGETAAAQVAERRARPSVAR